MLLARSCRMKLLYATLTYVGAAAALLAGVFFLITFQGPDDRTEVAGSAVAQTDGVASAAPAETPPADADRARPPVWIVPTAKYDYTPPPPRQPVAQEAKRDNANRGNENSASQRRNAERPNARDAIEATDRTRDAEPQDRPVLRYATPPG